MSFNWFCTLFFSLQVKLVVNNGASAEILLSIVTFYCIYFLLYHSDNLQLMLAVSVSLAEAAVVTISMDVQNQWVWMYLSIILARTITRVASAIIKINVLHKWCACSFGKNIYHVHLGFCYLCASHVLSSLDKPLTESSNLGATKMNYI